MKIHCKVIGHELKKRKFGDRVQVKLEGTDIAGFKATLEVDEGQRVRYPFGSAAIVDFDVSQQELPLEK